MMPESYDVAIVGGGINGAGIARDAAGRGLSVALLEKDDLAEGTSSRSGKLVHGGLRYLEYMEFRLVREALEERETLLKIAPHIIWPLRFVLPHSASQRPKWLIRCGLFLYDHLGRRKTLPKSRNLDLARDPEGVPLRRSIESGFVYSDCWVDDSRLVVLNAVDAAERGAKIMTRTRFAGAKRQGGAWRIEFERPGNGGRGEIFAKAIVNAGGPWVNQVIDGIDGVKSDRKIRLVQGSHIVTEKFWEGTHAYLLQNPDKRVIFAVPFEGDLALLGTTDTPFEGNLDDVEADEAEIEYLLKSVNAYFTEQLRQSDLIASYSGIRPLFDDGAGNPSAVTREYVLDIDSRHDLPALSVFGGKITTYRKLAESVLSRLEPFFPSMEGSWTGNAPLPGGDLPDGDPKAALEALRTEYPWAPRPLLVQYVRRYGSRTRDLIGNRASLEEMGRLFGPAFFEAEAKYLVENEFALTADDILWRRTKHRINMKERDVERFSEWLSYSGPSETA